jgi:hypothetical protein
MAIVTLGYVTRIGGSTTAYADSVDVVGNKRDGGSAYSVRKAGANGGTPLGMYSSVGAAKRALEVAFGSPGQIRWTQSNLRGDIEHYIATQGQP